MIEKSPEQLLAAGHSLLPPFAFHFEESRVLVVQELLRILPGKRLVARGDYNGDTVLAKLFFHARNAERELQGYNLLAKTGVLTPKLFSQHRVGSTSLCFYEYVQNAKPLDQLWKVASEGVKGELFDKLILLLKKMYDAGVYQTDLHLGNFLVVEENLYVLDPASCSGITSQDDIMNNLALLLAQLPLDDWEMAEPILIAHFPFATQSTLHETAFVRWKIRLQDFLKKIYRESTYVQTWRTPLHWRQHLLVRCVRQNTTEAMQQFLNGVVQQQDKTNELLKRGNSSIVSRAVIDGKPLVVKNSRNKTLWRLLRRCLRRSRGSNSWYFSHMLQAAGVNTPAPCALVERKWGPFVLESWFVSEFIEADSLLDVWHYEAPTTIQLDAIKHIFNTLKRLRASHGDMKGSNLLVCDQKLYLIDYDGMREHHNEKTFQKALEKDVERLLQNWKNPHLEQVLTRQMLLG